ncbi:hypothetical protein KAR91_75760 [Candidatus Pacearchaeota archaeon]|nr:hypothetical protein [Candidatus Pacearchaeota archaeon]
MTHLENALADMESPLKKFITVKKASPDLKGEPQSVCFQIQSDPVSEVGVNGCQSVEILEFTKCLLVSLNENFPSIYNQGAIMNIDVAISMQIARTEDRERRGVEGKYEA